MMHETKILWNVETRDRNLYQNLLAAPERVNPFFFSPLQLRNVATAKPMAFALGLKGCMVDVTDFVVANFAPF